MEIASGLGDGVFWVGLATYMLEAGVGPAGFALAAAARFGPRALISAPAGVIADRVDRRRLLVGLDMGRGALMVVLAIVAAADARYEVLLVLMVGYYALAAPYRPALISALPLVAGEDHLAPANAVISTTRQVMTFIGPVIGTAVLVISSPAIAFAFNAACFCAAAALMAQVPELSARVTEAGDAPATPHAGPSWRTVWQTTGLVVITVLVFTMYLARGAEVVLFVFLAEDQLGLGPSGVGILTGAVGFGAIVALPLATRLADRDRSGLMIVLSVASTALPLALLAWIDSPVAACVALAVVGAGIVVFETLSVVLLLRLSHRDVLGRVFGIVGGASNGGKLLGALLAPLIVAVWELPVALVAIGAGVAIIGVASVPPLRALTATIEQRRAAIGPAVDELAGLALFDGASRATLERIAASMVPESFEPDAVVIVEGEPADDLYIVRTGEFVATEGPHVVNRLSTSNWFGEIGLLQHRPRTATVTAVAPAEVWRIPGAVFLDALESGAAAPTAVLETMAARLAESERIHRDVAG